MARSTTLSEGPRVRPSLAVRLQCYEGLDEAKALYEWNYKKQLPQIQADEGHGAAWSDLEGDIFAEPFLLARPLLSAIRAEDAVVLLVDEIDRVEAEAEALMLEVLADFQVTIPELGTIVANRRPMVFLISNDSRDLSEALKRRLPLPTDRVPEHRTGTGHSSGSRRRLVGEAGGSGEPDRATVVVSMTLSGRVRPPVPVWRISAATWRSRSSRGTCSGRHAAGGC